VRTASGSTAVQIAESVAGRRRIVRHVGSARDEAELGLLMEEARRLLEDDQQGVLDLEITPQARQVAMIPAPGQPVLFGGYPAQLHRGVLPPAEDRPHLPKPGNHAFLPVAVRGNPTVPHTAPWERLPDPRIRTRSFQHHITEQNKQFSQNGYPQLDRYFRKQ
jgi:hypothetical protein